MGQHTEYLPYESIRWQAEGYDRLRRGAWDERWGLVGRVAQRVLSALLVPLILLGTPFRWLAERRRPRDHDHTPPSRGTDS